MAHVEPSSNLRLSVCLQELQEIQDHFRAGADVSDALRLLAEVGELPGLAGDPGGLQQEVDRAFHDLPGLLRVMADGVAARAEAGARLVELAREHALPRFRLKPGRTLAEVPAPFVRLGDPCLDQGALREAQRRGELPECLEADLP